MNSLSKAIDELANLFDNGHLEAATDPFAFVKSVTAEVTLLRARITELQAEQDKLAQDKRQMQEELYERSVAHHEATELADRLAVEIEYWTDELDNCQEGRDSIAAERDELEAKLRTLPSSISSRNYQLCVEANPVRLRHCEPHRFMCVDCGSWVHDDRLSWGGDRWPTCLDGCNWTPCAQPTGCPFPGFPPEDFICEGILAGFYGWEHLALRCDYRKGNKTAQESCGVF
jgi:hypothetical protein